MSRNLTKAPGAAGDCHSEDPIPGFSHQINTTLPFSHSPATVYMLQRRQRKEARTAFLQHGDSLRPTFNMAFPKQPRRGVFHIWLMNGKVRWRVLGRGGSSKSGGGNWKEPMLCVHTGPESTACLIHTNSVSSNPPVPAFLSASHGLVGSSIMVQGDSVQVSAQRPASWEA